VPIATFAPRSRGDGKGTRASRPDPGTLRGTRPAAAWAWGLGLVAGLAGLAGGGVTLACSTVDPGPNFVVPEEQFDADFFFCRVEPELLIAKRCGPGDPGAGDPANGCHFNSSAVGGRMALANHPPIECAADRPTNRAQLGAGGPAQGNLQAVTLVMSRDVQTAPLFLRPTGQNHPRQVFAREDPVVEVLRQWAQK
jgi:hypothetical protein